MPNFHEDYLAIAANEEDMHKVLMRFAANLYAHKEEIGIENEPNRQMMEDLGVPVLGLQREVGFNLDELAELDLRDLYREVGPLIDSWYMYSFDGALNPEGSEGTQLGWESSTSSADGYMEQVAVLAKALGNFTVGGGASIGLTAQPVGCPASDTASVGLNRYGMNWVLTVRYATAWCPNSEDLDYFFLGLPSGDYGVAFYDADEADDYEIISAFSGLHHGFDTMHATEGEREWDDIERDELKERRQRYSSMTKSDITDLPELARMAVACGWSEWGWEDEDEESCDEEYIDFNERPSLNWTDPSEKDLAKIDELILKGPECFPLCQWAEGDFTQVGKDAGESMLPGDAVVVTSEWGDGGARFFVRNLEGVELCRIYFWDLGLSGNWEDDRDASAVVACLLPYLRVSVWSLTPLSMRNKGAYGPKLMLRFDLEPVEASELVTHVHALLEKKLEDRALSSKGRE